MIVAFTFNLLTLPLTVHFVALCRAVPDRIRTLRTVTTRMMKILMGLATTLSFLSCFSKRTMTGCGGFGGGGAQHLNSGWACEYLCFTRSDWHTHAVNALNCTMALDTHNEW